MFVLARTVTVTRAEFYLRCAGETARVTAAAAIKKGASEGAPFGVRAAVVAPIRR